MEEQCASVTELDIESKYFETVPYDSDDPDITWYKTSSNSDEDKFSNDSESPASDQENQDPLKKQNTGISQNEFFDNCDWFLKLLAINSPLRPSQENGNIKTSRWDQMPCLNHGLETPNGNADESFKEIVRRRRRLNLANISKEFKKENKDYVRYPTNIYPDNWESVKEPPGTESNSYSSPSVPRLNTRNAPLVTRRSLPSSLISTPICSSPAPKRKSCNYDDFESTYKKIKKSPVTRRLIEVPEVMPCYKNYQLLGDSQLVRFSEQLLGCKQFVTYAEDTQSRRLGYCVSGQKIKGLEERILKKELNISDKLILLIGTNDMVYGTDLKSMCQSYDAILHALKENAERVVVLTVPPVPKLAHDSRHMPKLRKFNEFLISRADEEKVFVVDLASLFVSYSDTVSTQFFEQVYNKRRSNSKVDLIHLNRGGFKMLSTILDVEYFDKFPL